jgi:hypothetical protein
LVRRCKILDFGTPWSRPGALPRAFFARLNEGEESQPADCWIHQIATERTCVPARWRK